MTTQKDESDEAVREAWDIMRGDVDSASMVRGTMEWDKRAAAVERAIEQRTIARLAAKEGPLTMSVERLQEAHDGAPFPFFGDLPRELLAEVDARAAQVAALREQLAEADSVAAQCIALVRSGAKNGCAYCGLDASTLEEADAHVLTCARRPEAKLIAERDAALARLAEAERAAEERGARWGLDHCDPFSRFSVGGTEIHDKAARDLCAARRYAEAERKLAEVGRG